MMVMRRMMRMKMRRSRAVLALWSVAVFVSCGFLLLVVAGLSLSLIFSLLDALQGRRG